MTEPQRQTLKITIVTPWTYASRLDDAALARMADRILKHPRAIVQVVEEGFTVSIEDVTEPPDPA